MNQNFSSSAKQSAGMIMWVIITSTVNSVIIQSVDVGVDPTLYWDQVKDQAKVADRGMAAPEADLFVRFPE